VSAVVAEGVVRRGAARAGAASGWSLIDLDRWHEFEMKSPDTFAGMYQFSLRKRR